MAMQIGIALVALAAGIAAGAVVVARRSGHVAGPSRDAVAIARIQAQMDAHQAELRRIADAAAGRDLVSDRLREGLDGARRVLEQLRSGEGLRAAADADQREVIRRLATVLAGGSSQGRAGENILREHLGQLPPSMLVHDFRVGGRVVEFGLVLPDGRRLPIDSKWSAVAELEALEAAADPGDREACARAVEKAVTIRAREVAQYLDPALTAPVAIAAVPDAAYAVLRRAHADAYGRGVVIVPYGWALPIVLFLYALVQRLGDAADVQASLAEIGGLLDAMESVVENKFARAGTMVTNGAEEFRSHLGQARGSIARSRGIARAALTDDPEGPLTVVR